MSPICPAMYIHSTKPLDATLLFLDAMRCFVIKEIALLTSGSVPLTFVVAFIGLSEMLAGGWDGMIWEWEVIFCNVHMSPRSNIGTLEGHQSGFGTKLCDKISFKSWSPKTRVSPPLSPTYLYHFQVK